MSIRTGACLASGVARATSASGPIPNSSLGPAGSASAFLAAVVVVAALVVVGAPLVGLAVSHHLAARSRPGAVGWEVTAGAARPSPARPQAPSRTATRTGVSAISVLQRLLRTWASPASAGATGEGPPQPVRSAAGP